MGILSRRNVADTPDGVGALDLLGSDQKARMKRLERSTVRRAERDQRDREREEKRLVADIEQEHTFHVLLRRGNSLQHTRCVIGTCSVQFIPSRNWRASSPVLTLFYKGIHSVEQKSVKAARGTGSQDSVVRWLYVEDDATAARTVSAYMVEKQSKLLYEKLQATLNLLHHQNGKEKEGASKQSAASVQEVTRQVKRKVGSQQWAHFSPRTKTTTVNKMLVARASTDGPKSTKTSTARPSLCNVGTPAPPQQPTTMTSDFPRLVPSHGDDGETVLCILPALSPTSQMQAERTDRMWSPR